MVGDVVLSVPRGRNPAIVNYLSNVGCNWVMAPQISIVLNSTRTCEGGAPHVIEAADHRCNGKDGVHFIVHGTIWTPHSHSWKCNPQNRIPQELHEQQLNRHVQAPKANFFMQLPFAATTLGACLVDPNQRSGHPNTVKRSSEL